MTPRVSILMAVYNGMPYLEETLGSLLQQSLRDSEIVVVDDGSIDDTPRFLNECAGRDKRVSVLCNERNMKLPASLNRGLRVCQAPLVARADADDTYDAERLERQAQFLDNHPEVGVVGAACRHIDEKGIVTGFTRHPEHDRQIRFELPFRTCFSHPGVMFRRELVLGVGGYDERFWTGQDYELWARLIPRTKFANIPEVLWSYRIRSDSITQSKGQKHLALVRPVSQGLLSDYLDREISQQETATVLDTYRSERKMGIGALQLGHRLCCEYLGKAREREQPHTVRGFRRTLADAFMRQSVLHASECPRVAVKLWCRAIRFDVWAIMSRSSIRVGVRLALLRLPRQVAEDG